MSKKWPGYPREPKPLPQVWLTPLSVVAPRAIRWLWPGRVPLGKVTLLVGDPGRGKSLMALDMAARVTTGARWPDQVEPAASEACVAQPPAAVPCGDVASLSAQPRAAVPHGSPAQVGSVILLTAEDDVADTVRPRLEAAGGDPCRVAVLHAVKRPEAVGEQMFSLAHDIEVLEGCIQQLGDVRLVVMDPVSAYLTGADAHSNEGLRTVLSPLRSLAERAGVAVVAISHLTKKSDAAVMYRAMGSLAFVAAARAVWAVGPDSRTAGRLLFLPLKCNLTGGATGLAYRIVPSAQSPDVPVLAWEPGAIAMGAEEALDVQTPAATRRERAVAWLEGILAQVQQFRG